MLLEQYKHHPARQFASPYLYAGNGMNPIVGWDDDGNELDELGMELYDIFAEEDFFGSSVLKEDWNEMKNSYLTYHFVFSDEDYAWNIDETNTICLPSSKNTGETKQLQELAVLGRHEYDHLKGIPKAAWHDIAELYWRTNDYFEVMKKNNTLQEGMKRGHNVEKGYDRIYGRDYKAYQQMGRDDK